MRDLVGDLILVRLQEETDILLHKRLYNALRRSILDGSLPPHGRLPASRDLASELSISRNTVLTVYEQLMTEGYVSSRQGSGTFVEKTLPDRFTSTGNIGESGAPPAPEVSISRRGQHLLSQVSASPRQWGAFIPGVPDVNAFPHPLFSKIQARISRRPKPERLSYSCNGGTPELQHALVDYLRCLAGSKLPGRPNPDHRRDPTRLSIWLHGMLCDRGDLAWIEEPSYWGIRHVLTMNDVRITPLTVDRERPLPAGDGHRSAAFNLRHAVSSVPAGGGDGVSNVASACWP
ncbi:HTH-type transcriptional regulatory protein gabR [Cedecea neteri]|uniref:HTH-type transcriptional regulatory protein gabR n=1 Tax=Cedecea neteri TaxID=158822 RepID=A0A2X2T184_9ENTR|nr:HTH-type transcriptional regulatory protein gabR [Cedecea neteri]